MSVMEVIVVAEADAVVATSHSVRSASEPGRPRPRPKRDRLTTSERRRADDVSRRSEAPFDRESWQGSSED